MSYASGWRKETLNSFPPSSRSSVISRYELKVNREGFALHH
jgi:hypothetical protein